jgi:IS30 family transposase
MGTHYSHVNESRRMVIESLLLQNHSCRAIARQLGVAASTVTREVSRNRGSLAPACKSYQAVPAQKKTVARRRGAAVSRRKLGSNLTTPRWRVVLDGLRCGWSPQQIAGKLPRVDTSSQACLFPDLSISHETIYAAIYAQPKGSLRTELITLLRKSHKTRLPRTRGTARKGSLSNMTSIDLRPPEVAARIVPGHWEGDLIKGSMNRSAVGTLVERTSRYVMLVKLDGLTAQDILVAFTRRLKTVPESLRKTMTYDQGSEMALHQSLSKRLRMDIYFCDPHSPWQRGSNENANGLIREYLPKGMDLSDVSHQQLTAIEHSLNHRPRKILGYQSPYEVFSKLTSDLIGGVALQA